MERNKELNYASIIAQSVLKETDWKTKTLIGYTLHTTLHVY